MKKQTKNNAIIAAILGTSLLASGNLMASHATQLDQGSYKPVSLLVAGGYDFGGDKLVEIEYLDGSSDTIRTSQGMHLSVGGEFRPNGSDVFSIRGLAGFKFSTNRASDVDASIRSFPIELSANWFPSRDWRLGIGYVENLNTKFDSDFGNTDFEDASGPKYEIAFRGIALSYTDMDYVDENGFSYSADTFGISYSHAF